MWYTIGSRLSCYSSPCSLTAATSKLWWIFSDGRWLVLSYFSYPKLYTQSLNQVLDTVLDSTLMVMPSHDQLRFDQVGGTSIMGCSFFFLCFLPIGFNQWVVLISNIGSRVTLNSFPGNSSLSANNLWVIYFGMALLARRKNGLHSS
jgi:hypothetical protein